METQPGIGNKGISTFLSFGAKNVQPDILEKILVGRRETVDLLEQYVREIAQNGANHQVFMVGPRGAGKTHLLRVLYHRVDDLVQARSVVVAYFAEEEYGISGYLDFLIRIINAFMRWYDADGATLEMQLNILRETPESRQEYVAETIISDYVGNKPLLILSENFDAILEALGRQGQAQLRAFLYRHNRISIIASAQAISPDLGREDRPFYGFFSTIYLKKLSYEDSLALLVRLAETEQNPTMLTHLAGKGRAQVRAIHELVKGNHRLLVTFYEFLKADTLADLSVIFMKTMNDLKPYYETFIRFLPAQQQKILHYLALAKTPQRGTDIGKNCFIATASLNKQLNELQRRHLIDVLPDPTDKRNKLYDVSEPLLRIAIEIGEQREGITALFIDFLARCYSQDEIKGQMSRFESLYLSEDEPTKKQKLYWEMEARKQALEIKSQFIVSSLNFSEQLMTASENYRDADYYFMLGNKYANSEDYEEAIKAYKESLKIQPNISETWNNLGVTYHIRNEYDQSIESYQKALSIKPDDQILYNLGTSYAGQGDYNRAAEAFEKSIALRPEKYETWNNLGNVYQCQGNYNQAVEAYRKALVGKLDSYESWYNLGIAYDNQGDHKQAVKAYQEALAIKPEAYEAWSNLGYTYDSQANYDQAVEAYKQALSIKPDDYKIWNNLGYSYANQNDHAQAIKAYRKAISIKPDAYNTWRNLGYTYSHKDEHRKAVQTFQKALAINPNDSETWNNLGVTYSRQGDYAQAVLAYGKALVINPDSVHVWHNLGTTYSNQGDYAQAVSSYRRAIEIQVPDRGTVKKLTDAIIRFLQAQTATDSAFGDLESWLQGREGFEIIASYVNVYRRVVFGKEEKALYDLPKEQRIFFEREILKKTVE